MISLKLPRMSLPNYANLTFLMLFKLIFSIENLSILIRFSLFFTLSREIQRLLLNLSFIRSLQKKLLPNFLSASSSQKSGLTYGICMKRLLSLSTPIDEMNCENTITILIVSLQLQSTLSIELSTLTKLYNLLLSIATTFFSPTLIISTSTILLI